MFHVTLVTEKKKDEMKCMAKMLRSYPIYLSQQSK